jgi:hypothetical protein
MKPKRWIHLLLAAVLTTAALGTGFGSLAAQGPQAGPPAYIEPELQDVLQVEGQANLFVVFREQADLRAAYRLSWNQ